MLKVKFVIIYCLLIFSSHFVDAKTLVLVHGFMSEGMDWRSSGFTKPIQAAGYKDGGNYTFNNWGMVVPHSQAVALTDNVFYTLNLPSTTNLQTQEGILEQYLLHLYLQRLEPITLLGHSAGGLIARLYLLNPNRVPINGLITIASPHLGTPVAHAAYLAGNSPIGMMASMVGGGTLQDSRGLFSDLKEEKSNKFLYWMNHQHYPDIHYASIIRQNQSISPKKFDFVVPAKSQNMNNVWGLKGRSGVVLSKSNHALSVKDGMITAKILQHIR